MGTAPATALDDAQGERPMTRRDLVAALYPLVKRLEAQGTIMRASAPSITTYADLEGRDRDWAIELASQFHLFAGMPALSSGRFNGTLPVSRWETGMVLGELLGQTHPEARKLLPPTPAPAFSDLSPAERRRLEPVLAPGVLIGYPDQTFRAQEPLTQEQWESVATRLTPLAGFKAVPPAPRKAPSLNEDYRLLRSQGDR
ncbi:hypothetical protein D3C87_855390 [compost metagenome]